MRGDVDVSLKMFFQLWGLWSKIKNLNTEGFKNMGWKTITGAILMGVGYACKALMGVVPALAEIGDALIAIGVALGGIGARAAIAKVGK